MTTKKPKQQSKTIVVSEREAPIQRSITIKDLAVLKVMSEHQIKILTEGTPEYAIKTRPGGKGKVLKYVTHGYVKDVLNKGFGFDWDSKLLPYFNGNVYHQVDVDTGEKKKDKATGEIKSIIKHNLTVCVELIIRVHNPSKPSEIIATIVKTGIGSSVWYEENEWGDALKSARSDGVKVAATDLGIASDLYWDDEAEFSKHEEKMKSDNEEIIDAVTETNENNIPADGIKMLAMAKAQFGYDFPKIKDILDKPDYKLNDYQVSDWDLLKKHYEGEKK